MEFVLIPAGMFTMGSPDSDKEADDEKPAHQVTISKPFYLGKYEVTQEQWKSVMGTNPNKVQGDNTRPVETVSWKKVQQFIKKLNEREGVTYYRLPTEAEWEYAARAGTTTIYSFGDNVSQLGNYAWYERNTGPTTTTHPVGQKKPNAWGLYDMHGNVWEWVADRHGPYSADAVTDPTGPTAGTNRVIRGGAWPLVAGAVRAAFRAFHDPTYQDDTIGFRLARDQESQ
jgi:formylglycine-generating enzyme required for sulfatase activity